MRPHAHASRFLVAAFKSHLQQFSTSAATCRFSSLQILKRLSPLEAIVLVAPTGLVAG